MRYKLAAFGGVLLAMLFLVCVTIFGDSPYITQSDLDNINDRESMVKVAQIMLNDSERTNEIKAEEIKDITVMYGDYTGEGIKEAAINADFGAGYVLLSVYQNKNEKRYEYIDEIGVFLNTSDITSVKLDNKNGSTIFLNEKITEKIGSFEILVYNKGYAFDEKTRTFGNIYNYPIGIEADWNLLWDATVNDAPSRWEKLTQTTKSVLENGSRPVIRNTYHQEYLVSSETEVLNIPLANTYSLISQRDVEESFYWSDEWQAFILGEKIENTTGEKVAVLTLWKNLPYYLADVSDSVETATAEYNNLVRIRRKNGQVAIVNNSSLSDIRRNSTQSEPNV